MKLNFVVVAFRAQIKTNGADLKSVCHILAENGALFETLGVVENHVFIDLMKLNIDLKLVTN